MRYKLNLLIRNLLRKHYEKLSKTSLRQNLKNLIYKNKSISGIQLEALLKISKTSAKSLKIRPSKLTSIKNLGASYKPVHIKFKGKSNDFAEFVGIMLGDGNIYRNTIRITISNEEQDFKKHILALFSKLFEIKPKSYQYKKSKSLCLYAYSKDLRILLEKYGLCSGNKVKNNIKVPDWIVKSKNFSKHCMRGMIDTDGGVYFHKRDKQMYISFTSRSTNLLVDLQKMAKYFNIRFVRNNAFVVSIYKKKDVRTYLKKIGFSNSKHLFRTKKFMGL